MTQITLGPTQHRTCRCPHPRCFSDDEGRCHRCGYPRHRIVTASTRLLVCAIARILIQP